MYFATVQVNGICRHDESSILIVSPRCLCPIFFCSTVDNDKQCLDPLKNLLLGRIGSRLSAAALEDIDSLNFAGLRDMLLAEGPLDVAWIKKASLWLNADLAPVFPHSVRSKSNH